jgi:hypothetical protein
LRFDVLTAAKTLIVVSCPHAASDTLLENVGKSSTRLHGSTTQKTTINITIKETTCKNINWKGQIQ